MKLRTQEDASKKPEFRLALIGRSFARKSSLAAHFPKPGFLDADLNVSRIRDRYPKLQFTYLQPQYDDAGKLLPKEAMWRNALAQMDALCASPDVRTVIVDSASSIQEMIIDWILSQPNTGKMNPLTIGGVKVLNQEQYRPFADQFCELIVRGMNYGKPLIFLFHEQEERNERGTVEAIWPLLTSRLRFNVTRMFTDAWRLTTSYTQKDANHPTGVAYKLQLVPGDKMSSLGASGQFVDSAGKPATEVEILFTNDGCNWPTTIGKAFPWLASLSS